MCHKEFGSKTKGVGVMLFLIVLLVSPSWTWAQPVPQEDGSPRRLTIRVGDQQSISARGIRNFSVGVEGIADVRVTTDGSRFVIVGRTPGITTLLLIPEQGPQLTYQIVVLGLDDVPQGIEERETIRLDFYFVQFEDNYDHQIGIGWPGSIGSNGVFNFGLDFQTMRLDNATVVLSDQPLARLDMMEATGWARILRQVTLVTANGNEATFTSGGEFNVTVTSAMAAEVRSISFGSTIQVIPRYDRSTGRIELQVEAEIRDLNDNLGVGVPGVTNSIVETLVNLSMGEAVVLGGLVSNLEMISTRGLPGLSRIPVLGLLFGSRQNRRQARQVVLFIVPSVVDVASDDALEQIRRAVGLYWNHRGRIDRIQLLPEAPSLPSVVRPANQRRSSRRSR